MNKKDHKQTCKILADVSLLGIMGLYTCTEEKPYSNSHKIKKCEKSPWESNMRDGMPIRKKKKRHSPLML